MASATLTTWNPCMDNQIPPHQHTGEPISLPAEVEAFRKVNIEAERAEDLFYILAMFPYPSAALIHVWHVLNYTATDILARFKRAQGKKVIFPQWFDSFWLPTEDYARKVNRPAHEVTVENIANFKQQLEALNLSYDWSREISTSSPEFYKRTQWLFIQLYKAGYAYKKKSYVYRDPVAETVIAKNQIVDWKSERSGATVELREVEQWFIKTTAFAEELIAWLSTVDMPEDTRKRQLDLIGKQEGFRIKTQTNEWIALDIFLQDIASLQDVHAIILPPEFFSEEMKKTSLRSDQVQQYHTAALSKTLLERRQSKRPTYRNTGQTITLPWTQHTVPVIVADYIDEHEPLWVKILFGANKADSQDDLFLQQLQTDLLTSSNDWVSESIVNEQELIETQIATPTTIYNLEDWSVWRQRSRWAPIPVWYEENWTVVPVPDQELPVVLPTNNDPHTNPLQNDSFIKAVIDGKPVSREPNTFDTFVCSSWYYLRFLDPKNPDALINRWISTKISQVDFYMGGNEHATWHLVYARMIHKFLYKIWIVDTEEPFKKVFHQWMIHWSDWRKMSKRYGNGIQPNELLKDYTVDEIRMWIMFMGPLDQQKNRSTDGFKWIRRFLYDIESITTEHSFYESDHYAPETKVLINKCTADYESLKYNVVISHLMSFKNDIKKNSSKYTKKDIEALLILLQPLAPQSAQKARENLWNKGYVEMQSRPTILLESTENASPIKVMINWKMQQVSLPSSIDRKTKEEIFEYLSTAYSHLFQKHKWAPQIHYREWIMINIVFPKIA